MQKLHYQERKTTQLYIVTLPLLCNYLLYDNFVKDIVTFQASESNIRENSLLIIHVHLKNNFELKD